MIEVVDTVEKLEKLKPVWQELETAPGMRLPQTFDWNYIGWKEEVGTYQGNRLWVLHWDSGKGDHVIFPFFIDGRGELKIIMDTHNDVCDMVYRRGENHHMAFYEAAEEIAKCKDVKSIWFRQLSGSGEALNYFGVLFPARILYRDHAYSWIRFTGGEDFIQRQAHLRSKDKANLKALLRKSGRHDLAVYAKANGQDFPHDVIVEMRDNMLLAGNRVSHFFPDTMVTFAEKMYDLGHLKMAVLRDEGKVVAFNFLECMQDRELSWIFMYTDPHSSTELYVKYFHQESSPAVPIFDFGVGAYRYKLGTFRPELGVTFSMQYGKTHGRQLMALMAAVVRYLKDYLKLWYKPEHH